MSIEDFSESAQCTTNGYFPAKKSFRMANKHEIHLSYLLIVFDELSYCVRVRFLFDVTSIDSLIDRLYAVHPLSNRPMLLPPPLAHLQKFEKADARRR